MEQERQVQETISRKNRKILNDISNAIGASPDIQLYNEYGNTSVDTARGYLAGFAAHGPTQEVLLMYFLLRLVTEKS